MSDHGVPQPLERRFWTPGVIVLAVLAAAGFMVTAYRLVFGLGAVTNLDNYYPWGIWIAVDVASGVALAAGGFTTAFLAHILNRHKYEPIVRPALLTAMLGYTFVALGVFTDLGRYYHMPLFFNPHLWQFNSALFEVGLCVMTYLTVLYIEFLPVVTERFMGKVRLRGELAVFVKPLEALLRFANRTLDKTVFLFAILGVVLSCMHQSSLGTLLTIAPTKVHPLWWTPILPLLFLTSAVAVGFPMVIFESILAHRSFGMKPEMDVLSSLARLIPWTIGTYLALKIGDMVVRGSYVYLLDFNATSNLFLIELVVGVIIPFCMFLNRKVRETPALIFGVLLNRLNVFITAFHPPYAAHRYVPAFWEVVVTVGYISALMFLYRVCVTVFPVIPKPEEKKLLPGD